MEKAHDGANFICNGYQNLVIHVGYKKQSVIKLHKPHRSSLDVIQFSFDKYTYVLDQCNFFID